MRFGVIGADNAGTSVAGYFKSRGFIPVGFYARDFADAVESAVLLGAKAYQTPEEIAADCELIVISAPDDTIGRYGKILDRAKVSGKYICHLSSVLSASAIRFREERGNTFLSLFAPYPFSSKACTALSGIPLAIEGFGNGYDTFLTALRNANIPILELTAEQKPIYRLGISMIFGCGSALLAVGESILLKSGFQSPQALEALLTAELHTALSHSDSQREISDPVSRGDASAIRRDMQTLSENFPQGYTMIYRLLNSIAINRSTHDNRIKTELKEALLQKEN